MPRTRVMVGRETQSIEGVRVSVLFEDTNVIEEMVLAPGATVSDVLHERGESRTYIVEPAGIARL